MQRRWPAWLAAAVALAALAAPALIALGEDSPPGPSAQQVTAAVALGNEFTYQGRLTDSNNPANGAYDFQFILYNAEVGGSQVGPIVTVNDVSVTGGLFTTQLDFGPNMFQGQARWLEIFVRPGASLAAYQQLTPRQEITATPYALYAMGAPWEAITGMPQGLIELAALTCGPGQVPKHSGTAWTCAADSFSLPFSGNAGSDFSLFSVDQSGTGSAAFLLRSYTGASTNPALLVTNAGSGAGILGQTSYANGTGVIGRTTNPTGVGLEAQGAGATGTALEIQDGPIRVTGTTRTAFRHIATGPTIAGNNTVIDHPLTNGDPDALLFVTQNWEPNSVYNNSEIGVFYTAGKWRIFNQNLSAMPVNSAYNVLVIKQ